MVETITLEELLAEIDRTSREHASGATLREMKNAMKISEHRLKELIRAGLESGMIEAGRSERPAIDGTMRPVPVYRASNRKKKRQGG